MKVKVTEKTHVTMQSIAVIQQFRELFKKHYLGQFVLGSRPRSVQAQEVQHLLRRRDGYLKKFKGRVLEGEGGLEGEMRAQTVSVDDGQATTTTSRSREGPDGVSTMGQISTCCLIATRLLTMSQRETSCLGHGQG